MLFMRFLSRICLLSFREIKFIFSENIELLDAYLNSIKHLEGHLLQMELKNIKTKVD